MSENPYDRRGKRLRGGVLDGSFKDYSGVELHGPESPIRLEDLEHLITSAQDRQQREMRREFDIELDNAVGTHKRIAWDEGYKVGLGEQWEVKQLARGDLLDQIDEQFGSRVRQVLEYAEDLLTKPGKKKPTNLQLYILAGSMGNLLNELLHAHHRSFIPEEEKPENKIFQVKIAS